MRMQRVPVLESRWARERGTRGLVGEMLQQHVKYYKRRRGVALDSQFLLISPHESN